MTNNMILIIASSIIIIIIVIIILVFAYRKNECKIAFIDRFENGECIYNVLNKNLNKNQMKQVCNAILKCNEDSKEQQIKCLYNELTNIMTSILSELKNRCGIDIRPQ